jgi:hypothetical protein
MLENLGDAIRPLAKEPYLCDDRTCEIGSATLDDLVTSLLHAWRSGLRTGVFGKLENKKKLKHDGN